MNPLLTAQDELRQIDIVKIYNNKKCLVVDDFPEIRGSLTRTLKTFGVNTVDTAANGDEAIKACSKKKYDIVLCDYNLGAGKDGQQILEEVRYLRVLLMTSLFVMITGESSREMVLGALECQPDDYITKPYTQQSLRLRLDKAIVKHETLLPIKKSISEGDYRSALDSCNEMIASGSRYSADCLKIKGQLHFLLKQLKDAQKLYNSILGKKPVIWAKLGMGKTQLALGNLESAEQIFQSIIDEDERYVEAHDLLADVHKERKNMMAAQRATENATRISPKSVLRHRQLAELADHNNDDDAALRSHQNAIKWGMNSCHESEQDYFNYARKVSEVIQGNPDNDAKMLARQGHNFLNRARKRYADKPEITAQAQMVEAQLHVGSGDRGKAKEALQKAREMYAELATPPLATSLEMARALHSADEETEARELLSGLAARYEHEPEVLQLIDGITGEPISDAGKVVATKLTKEGIESYEKRDFAQSIDVFVEALANYPKHSGLNLNLIQAIIADTEARGLSERYEKLCRRCLRAVGTVGPDNKQYKRYAFLTKQLEKYYPGVLQS